MEENDVSWNANLPLQPLTNSKPSTSRGKFGEHVTIMETMEQQMHARLLDYPLIL